MPLALLLMLAAAPASGQMLVRPDSEDGRKVSGFFRMAEAEKAKDSLRCSAVRLPPRMGFDFRMWSGYQVTVPAREFGGKAGELAILLRVKDKESGKEYYFFSGRFQIPVVENLKNQELVFDGGFYAGKGAYEVDLVAADASSRLCRKGWSIKADPGKVDAGLPANTVSAMTPNRWRGFSPAPGAAISRVTILLHAAPVRRRRFVSKLSGLDRAILLNSLTSVLTRGSFNAARVAVFDLDGRRVLFEAEEFTPQSYRSLIRTLDQVNFGTVDIATLNRGPRPDALLADLLAREHAAEKQSDAIVFLGPAHRLAGKMLDEVKEVKLELPPTYYFTFSWFRVAPADWIDRVVKKLARGKVVPIATPEDLSKAILNLSRQQGS
ncbi:MAG: hypothetical protein SFV51_31140 [Bryobacteraceae bacterium]|nr:hypothetical protein [Bryobacteraceae bacterium]